MEPRALIDLLERSPDEALASLKRDRGTPGLSRAYCARVLELYAMDSGRALQLGSHWSMLLRYGDEPAPVHRVRGIFYQLKGRWKQSAEAFQLAGKSATDEVERYSFQVGAVDALARIGRVEEAVELGETLSVSLTRLGRPDLAARVRFNLGSAMYWHDRMELARQLLADAIAPLRQAGFLAEAASAEMALAVTYTYSGNLKLAREHGTRARSAALDLGMQRIADECDQNLAHVELLAGEPDKALDRLLSLRHRFADTPAVFLPSLEFLGDAYLRLNLYAEAIDAYQEAISQDKSLIPLHRSHLHLGIGQANLALGKHAMAIQSLRTAASGYARLKVHSWQAAVFTTLARLELDRGSALGALRFANQAVAKSADAVDGYHTAEAHLLLARLSGESKHLDKARELIQSHGYVSLLWEAEYVAALLAQGEQRLAHFRTMFDAILAGRMQVSSLTSRSSYLRNKAEALQQYLAELLEDSSEERVAEAVGVVEQTRSITLLDEVLASRQQSLSEDVRERLAELRERLRDLGTNDAVGSATRRLSVPQVPLASIQRSWVDLTRDVRAQIQTVVPKSQNDTIIFAATAESIYRIEGSRRTLLYLSRLDLERKLKWLQFELLSPMADRDLGEEEATEMVRELAESLLPAGSAETVSICPDGPLWRVPWAACAGVLGSGEVELRLHPSLGGHSHRTMPDRPKVALWMSHASDLAHAGLEAQQFMDRFPDARVFNTAAEVRGSLTGEYDLIHVVAHAKHRTANPMFSSIQFEDGPLLATEIARSDLRSHLVTLSACETGTMSIMNREEPDGLARAFLARGAYNVIASMWPLDDEAASRVFDIFFASLNDDATIREALRQARQTVREWRRHPYFWGSLALYGGYGQ